MPEAWLQLQPNACWQHAQAGTLKTEAQVTQVTQTAIWLAATCVRIAGACFVLGGSNAPNERSPLQRRLCDLHAAAQHAAARLRHYVGAGKLFLGSSVPETEL